MCTLALKPEQATNIYPTETSKIHEVPLQINNFFPAGRIVLQSNTNQCVWEISWEALLFWEKLSESLDRKCSRLGSGLALVNITIAVPNAFKSNYLQILRFTAYITFRRLQRTTPSLHGCLTFLTRLLGLLWHRVSFQLLDRAKLDGYLTWCPVNKTLSK